jgi:LysR family hca operon transcriptional activator
MAMELRHLRYFVAVAEERSFTHAAEQRLHTAQPSLSRQIRDLEQELGATLLIRGPRDVDLTPAGQVFLDHARVILRQVEVAREATRRAAQPAKTPFTVGFLTGYEMEWLPRVMAALNDALPDTELTIHSAPSPELIEGLQSGKIDVAFLRQDQAAQGLIFQVVAQEKLFALLPTGHRLAARRSIRLDEIADGPFINFVKSYAPSLRRVIDDYFADAGVHLVAAQEAETLPMVISLVLSTGGTSLLPAYMEGLLPPSVVSRKLSGRAPTIALAVGYSATNTSPLLQRILARAADVAARGVTTG